MRTTRARGALIVEAYAPYIRKGSRTLDVGCGNGIVSRILADRFSLDLVGTDIDDYRKEKVPFVLMDGKKLPFLDDAFELVLMNDMLHHADDQAALIAEARRVGRTVLIYEVEPGPGIALFDRCVNFFHHRGMPVPLAFRTADGWRRFMTERGIAATVVPLGRPRWWYPFRHVLIVTHTDHGRTTSAAHQSADGQLHPR
ncbi:MAG TPA: class I SAM-dependent methyltransferase [Candidatus Binatia bacterium]|nr:class I SAM-dependent methyltransferase [Candidatus Binatia bacterium]